MIPAPLDYLLSLFLICVTTQRCVVTSIIASFVIFFKMFNIKLIKTVDLKKRKRGSRLFYIFYLAILCKCLKLNLIK